MDSHTQKKIRNASLIMVASVLLSRIIGFAREWALAKTVGASAFTDVYYASFTIPDFLNYLMASGAVSISLIPLLAEYKAQGKEETGKRFFRSLSTNMGLLMILFILVGMVLAVPLSRLIAPGFNESQIALLATLTRIILPAQFFFYWGALAIAAQQTEGKFFLPALAPLIYNAGIIFFGVLLHEQLGVMGFSIGVVVGCFFSHGITQWIGMKKLGYRIMPLLDFSPEMRAETKKYIKLTLPIMVGLSIVVTDEWVTKFFGSQMQDRAISWLSYARTGMRIPIAVIGQAAGVAIFPYLSKSWAEKNYAGFASTFGSQISKLFFLSLLATVLCFQHALPMTQALYGSGKLSAFDLIKTSECLRWFSFGIFFWIAQLLLARGFYAGKQNWFPSLLGTAVAIFTLPLYQFLSQRYSVEGLAMASSAAIAAYSLTLGIALEINFRKKCKLPLVTPQAKNLFLLTLTLPLFYFLSQGVWILNLYHETQVSAFIHLAVVSVAVGIPLFFLLHFFKDGIFRRPAPAPQKSPPESRDF
jgi:putative peptidoglycan lipid II flippase